MAKYSFEFKMKVVQAFNEGEGSYVTLAKEYGIASTYSIQKWVNAYQHSGPKALMRSRQKKKFSTQFKLDIVKLYLTEEMTYLSLANQFGIRHPETITRWVKEFREQGIDGLREKKRGRPSKMTNKKKPEDAQKKEYSQEEIDEIELLKDRILGLEIQNAFLKKKIELREARKKEMKKRRE